MKRKFIYYEEFLSYSQVDLCIVSILANACDKMQWIAVEILVSVWAWTGDNVSLLPITGSPLLVLLSVRTAH